MPTNTRYFALEEARLVLRKILPELSRLVSLKKILDSKQYDIYRHEYFGGSGPNGTKHYPPELEELVKILNRFASENIFVKSLDDGLIDFPYVRENGDEAYLCYKLGEEDIMFWHSVESGFAGRRSITQL